jgi:adenylate cyclase
VDFLWEEIGNFGSLRERDCFVAWMQTQIAQGVAEEIEAPAGDIGERRFRHKPSGSLWRLVPVENPYGPGFWPVDEDDIPHDLPSVDDHRNWPPTSYR